MLITRNLTKRFGALTAVNNVSLSVKTGEIYGFLGLNGAGKTTAIRMLLGLISPDSGEASVLGEKIRPGRGPWERTGYLVEMPNAWPELSVFENLDAFRRLRGIRDKSTVDKTIDSLHLSAYRNIPAGNLSQGNKQRLGLAKAIFHRPEVLILDEPANGLDPAGIREIRLLLKKLAEEDGTTVLVSSHQLSEISLLANRIGIIHHGKLIRELDAAALDANLKRRLLLDGRDRKAVSAILEKEGYAFKAERNGPITLTGERAVRFPDELASILVHAGFPPTLLKVDREGLEAYFLRLIQSQDS